MHDHLKRYGYLGCVAKLGRNASTLASSWGQGALQDSLRVGLWPLKDREAVVPTYPKQTVKTAPRHSLPTALGDG